MNSLDKKIAELGDMIDLAEKVSDNIDVLVKRRANILLNLTFSIVLTVSMFISLQVIPNMDIFYNEKQNIIIVFKLLFLFSILLVVGSSYNYMRNYSHVNGKIRRESDILRKLLNMIHPFQESFSEEDIGIMRKAIIDMKLSRIKFSNIEDPKPTRKKEHPVSQEPAPTP